MKIIPREKRKHFGWSPEQQVPQRPSPAPAQSPQASTGKIVFTIDDLIEKGNPILSEENSPSGMSIGVADSLRQVQEYIGSEGVIASMPYLIAGKSKASKGHYLWKTWLTAFSEENVGIDKTGKYTEAGKPVVITVHGDGILSTPERIMQAYSERLTSQNAAKLTDLEFDNLLMGILPTGAGINIYTIDDIKKGNIISNPLGRYAVALDFETAKATKSGYHQKNQFIENPLVLARAGTLEYLSAYFDKAKDSDGDVANYHRLADIDPTIPQGRVLFVNGNQDGLSGNDNLYDNGRFVGVAPEAPRSRR